MSQSSDAPQIEKRLDMYGGILGGLIPMLVLIIGLVWLSVAKRGGTEPFWACAWMALVVGLLFARDKAEYCKAAMRGIGDKTGIVIVTAWLFAGVFGKLMAAGGLVNGMLWVGMSTGLEGCWFVGLIFFAAMLFAMGTGDSTGTCIALAPVLYPAGVMLGGDPSMCALAILSGSAFGDNVAPISDTTIVSAYTQGATMKDVVISRLPMSLTAAAVAMLVFIIFGDAGEAVDISKIDTKMVDAKGAFMLIAVLVVVFAAMKGRHLIEALIYGNISAAIIGILIGNTKISMIFSIPEKAGDSTGLIQAGLGSVVGPLVFALLVLAVTEILIECGIMRRILNWASDTMVKSARQAELFIIGLTVFVSIPLSANAPAELLVGPSLVKPIGEKFRIAPARRANLMDAAVNTVFFMLPWHICVVVWYGVVQSAAEAYALPVPPLICSFLNPYSWTLLIVTVFSAYTGWTRTYMTGDEKTETF